MYVADEFASLVTGVCTVAYCSRAADGSSSLASVSVVAAPLVKPTTVVRAKRPAVTNVSTMPKVMLPQRKRLRPWYVEKSTFCIQRTREGRNPACVEACPTGARVFGNLLDPDSDIRWVLEHKKVFRLKEDLGTEPKFWYFMD